MSLLDLLPDDIAASSNAEKKACPYIAEIDSQMEQLGEMIKANNAKQEEIRALRDGVSINNPSLDSYTFLSFSFCPGEIAIEASTL